MFFSEDQCKNLSSELQDKLKQMEVAVFEVKHKKQIEITVVNMSCTILFFKKRDTITWMGSRPYITEIAKSQIKKKSPCLCLNHGKADRKFHKFA